MSIRCQAHGGYFASGCSGCEETAERRHAEDVRNRLAALHDELGQERAKTASLRSALRPFISISAGLAAHQPMRSKQVTTLARKLASASETAKASGLMGD